jgi:hypothetical protein
MNAYLKSLLYNVILEATVYLVALRDEIEGGSKTEPNLELDHLMTILLTQITLNIMRQDECKTFASRPPSPGLWGPVAIFINGPDTAAAFLYQHCTSASKINQQGFRKDRL